MNDLRFSGSPAGLHVLGGDDRALDDQQVDAGGERRAGASAQRVLRRDADGDGTRAGAADLLDPLR